MRIIFMSHDVLCLCVRVLTWSKALAATSTDEQSTDAPSSVTSLHLTWWGLREWPEKEATANFSKIVVNLIKACQWRQVSSSNNCELCMTRKLAICVTYGKINDVSASIWH